MNNNIQLGINQHFAGYYRAGIVNPVTDEVEWKVEGKNLILTQGLNNLYNMSVADQTLYGVCGVGTRPNSLDSGGSQISQSGGTVYLSNNGGSITDFTSSYSNVYASIVQVGDTISCSNGQLTVTAVNGNGVNLTVFPSYTYSPQGFIVFKTSQVGLQSEISRSNSYFGGAGNCGTTFLTNTATHRRSYDFPILLSDMQYNELGVGWASTGASTVFSRILITPITVLAGFYLRVVYDLQTSWSPTGSIYGAVSIGGWPVSPSTSMMGTHSVQKFLCSYVNTSGASVNSLAPLDPYYIYVAPYYWSVWASQNSQSLAAFGSAVDRTTGYSYSTTQGSKAAYANDYISDKTGVVGNFVSNQIRSVGFGVQGSGADPAGSTYQAYTFVFNEPQTLQGTQTLSLTFRYTWTGIAG